jgi:hypothetical protein
MSGPNVVAGLFDDGEKPIAYPAAMKVAGGFEVEDTVGNGGFERLEPRLPGLHVDPGPHPILKLIPLRGCCICSHRVLHSSVVSVVEHLLSTYLSTRCGKPVQRPPRGADAGQVESFSGKR